MFYFIISSSYQELCLLFAPLVHLSAWRAGVISLAMSNVHSCFCLAVGLDVGVSNSLQKAASSSSSSLCLCSSNPAETPACEDQGAFILTDGAVGLELGLSCGSTALQ